MDSKGLVIVFAHKQKFQTFYGQKGSVIILMIVKSLYLSTMYMLHSNQRFCTDV